MILLEQEISLSRFVINFCFFLEKLSLICYFEKIKCLGDLTLLHEDKLSENLRLSQTKITKKVCFLIYFPKKTLWSERNLVLIFYCL